LKINSTVFVVKEFKCFCLIKNCKGLKLLMEALVINRVKEIGIKILKKDIL